MNGTYLQVCSWMVGGQPTYWTQDFKFFAYWQSWRQAPTWAISASHDANGPLFHRVQRCLPSSVAYDACVDGERGWREWDGTAWFPCLPDTLGCAAGPEAAMAGARMVQQLQETVFKKGRNSHL